MVALAAQLLALGDRDAKVRPPGELVRDLGPGAAAADHEDVDAFHHEPPRNPTNTRA